MAKQKNNRNWIVLLVLVALIFVNFSASKKEAITSEGTYCVEDEGCPCWGAENGEGIGIGIGRCVDNACSMTYCFDTQPVWDWVVDHPIEYLRSNILFTALIVGLLLWVGFFWPK